MRDDLGDRMKDYENAFRIKFPKRLPIIIRVDGRAFHTLTKSYNKPFDKRIEVAMRGVALRLCQEISGAVFAYQQSDEISILIRNDQTLQTEPWFANNLQKMVSIAAGIASVIGSELLERMAVFDARAFIVPPSDVVNYFIWRQQDATRNSISMLARSLYSHKACHNKNSSELQEMIFQKGKNWDKLPAYRKRGTSFFRRQKAIKVIKTGEICLRNVWESDLQIPIFTKNRDYVEKWLTQTSHEESMQNE